MPLIDRSFSDIITFSRASGATWFNSVGVLQGVDFSVTSNTIGTGSKTFTLDATGGVDRYWTAGDTVLISDQANSANNMVGTVTSYNASTQVLVCNITSTGGSGTITSWRIGSTMPRFDYDPATLAARGFLIEEARTNSIRNNTMVGGAAGNAPTNWTANGSTVNGITVTVVGVGTENGIAYVDYEINGTATITGTAINIVFDTTTGIAASAAQVWVWSSYLKLAAGTLTDLTFTPRLSWRDSGGGALTSNDGTSVPTSAGLATQRYSFSATAPASTNYVQPQLRIGTVNGSTYTGVQIRIGLPQLELGAFATSVIPTTTTALTRAADVASVNTLSPWYNAAEGTLFAEFSVYTSIGSKAIAGITDGTTNNRIQFFASAADPYNVSPRLVSGGAATNPSPAGSVTVGSTGKAALAYAIGTNQGGISVNGSAVNQSSPASAFGSVTQLELGKGSGLTQANGYLRRITYYPRRLSNAELQAITA